MQPIKTKELPNGNTLELYKYLFNWRLMVVTPEMSVLDEW